MEISVGLFAVLVTLVGVFLGSSLAAGMVVYKVWRENPGIITKSFYPGPDRRPSVRPAAASTDSAGTARTASSKPAAGTNGSTLSTKGGKDTPGTGADSRAPGGDKNSGTAMSQVVPRKRSMNATKPVMEENKTFDWEIDPKKLRMKYVVGKGNFGEVWLATWLGSPVAVKTIVPELQNKEKLVKRFIDEILLMSMLHHPNVVLFLGACTIRPNLCLVLEYCVHGSLHHFLKTEREHGIRITMSLIYRFALDIARGVYYLHRRCKVVQRDLKARNILVDESLNAKVADFGLSRVMDDEKSNKLTACGTPAWTAPEIVKMEAYTEKVDVYSFGIIMWELITRQEPYSGQKGVQIAYAAAEQGLRPEIPAYCPPDYAELMRQCWSDDPNDRPEFSAILKKLFQLKKACDIAAAASLAEGGEGGGSSTILAPTLPPVENKGGGDSDDDSGDDAIPIPTRATPAHKLPPAPKVPAPGGRDPSEGRGGGGGKRTEQPSTGTRAHAATAQQQSPKRTNASPPGAKAPGKQPQVAAGVSSPSNAAQKEAQQQRGGHPAPSAGEVPAGGVRASPSQGSAEDPAPAHQHPHGAITTTSPAERGLHAGAAAAAGAASAAAPAHAKSPDSSRGGGGAARHKEALAASAAGGQHHDPNTVDETAGRVAILLPGAVDTPGGLTPRQAGVNLQHVGTTSSRRLLLVGTGAVEPSIVTAIVQRDVDMGVVNLRAAKGAEGDWDGSVSSDDEEEGGKGATGGKGRAAGTHHRRSSEEKGRPQEGPHGGAVATTGAFPAQPAEDAPPTVVTIR